MRGGGDFGKGAYKAFEAALLYAPPAIPPKLRDIRAGGKRKGVYA